MTREAKIGMLTGLGVIVLIGVLLSEYLGNPGHGMTPTGRMAELPMGAAYRQEVMDPVGVPGMARTDGAGAPAAMTASAGNVPAGSPDMPVPAVAGNQGMSVPSMGGTATAVQVGDGSAGAGSQMAYDPGQPKPAGQTGTITFSDNTTAPGMVAAGGAVKGTEYVIAPGDTLNKIAAKFFKTNKSDGIKQIVAANPTVLKDDKTMLVAGKKLIIPTVAAAKGAVGAAPVVPVKKPAAVVIHPPGTGNGGNGQAQVPAPPEAAGVKETMYVVQAGDTLEKIARKVAPSNVSAMVKKLEEANGIKDPSGLKVGQKLKVPAA